MTVTSSISACSSLQCLPSWPGRDHASLYSPGVTHLAGGIASPVEVARDNRQGPSKYRRLERAAPNEILAERSPPRLGLWGDGVTWRLRRFVNRVKRQRNRSDKERLEANLRRSKPTAPILPSLRRRSGVGRAVQSAIGGAMILASAPMLLLGPKFGRSH
jgi:hypothetical protein